MKKIKLNQNSLIKKEVTDFLAERSLMLKSGFPYCYVENFVHFHCDSCIKFYRNRKETHENFSSNFSTIAK